MRSNRRRSDCDGKKVFSRSITALKSFSLTDDAYGLPDESKPAESAHVLGPATGRPQPYHVFDAKEHDETNFLWKTIRTTDVILTTSGLQCSILQLRNAVTFIKLKCIYI